MKLAAALATGIVAMMHTGISGVEMFGWMTPDVRGPLGFTWDQALKAEPIVKNAGLYNGFVAAGLFWGLVAARTSPARALSVRVFFLCCVIIAGIFGAATLPRTPFPLPIPATLALQTIPGAIALALVWAARPKEQADLRTQKGERRDARPASG